MNMTSIPTRLSLALGVAAIAMLAANCAGKRVNEVWYPIPDRTADSQSPASRDVRGTRTAAAAIPGDEDTEIIRDVLVQFYFPTSGQARWIDPRPLAHVRGAADDTVGADFDWVDEIVALAHRPNICPLDGRLETRGLCKGKPGGVLRFSTPYSAGRDSAIVYATYRPVPDSTGKVGRVGNVGNVGKPESELQFRLRRSDDGWVIRGKTTVSPGGSGHGDSREQSDSASLAITNVTIVDGRNSLPKLGQTVIIRGNRIVAVGTERSTPVPKGARIIDGRGKFLIPGLWDMHVHTSIIGGRALLSLYVANGVTGVRDMAGDWDTLRTWRKEIAAGTLVGPRIIASGPYLEGGDVPIPHLLARTPEEGAAGVDSLIKLGVDFVKVHTQLKPEVHLAILRRARERGVVVSGHVSNTLGSAAASDSGQKSIEHMLGIPAPCTPAESLALKPRYAMQSAVGRCRSLDLSTLYAKFVKNGTWVTPTFVAIVEVAGWPAHDVPGDTLVQYLPDTLKKFVSQLFPMPDSIPPNADSVGRAMLAKRMTQLADMHHAGVPILTGTDAPLRNSPPGFGLHEEMLMLTRGGLSPFEAMRAATLAPARYLGITDSAGTVEAGKRADLILLDASPLLDIRNTRRITAVVFNGRLIDSTERAKLLRAAMDK
jgi:imidazolonepropionase-like amidohydrolase